MLTNSKDPQKTVSILEEYFQKPLIYLIVYIFLIDTVTSPRLEEADETPKQKVGNGNITFYSWSLSVLTHPRQTRDVENSGTSKNRR